jgi:hypothetical protein
MSAPRLLPLVTACCLVSLTSGCYFSAKPAKHAYLTARVDFKKRLEHIPSAQPAKAAAAWPKLVVMPLWNSLVTNPVGGLYDDVASSISSLQGTFFHRDVRLPIWEGCVEKLRRYGLRVYKDYGDTGNPPLMRGLLARKNVVFLRATIASFVHDQRRTPKPWDHPSNNQKTQKRTTSKAGEQGELRFEATQIVLLVDLIDVRGRVLWRSKVTTYAKKAFHRPIDLLRRLGFAVADALVADRALKTAMSKTPAAIARASR